MRNVAIPGDMLARLMEQFERILSDTGVQVILFGSRATHQHRSDSDIDLALRGLEQRKDLEESLKKALSQCGLPVDIEVIPEEEASPATLQRIEQEGVALWPET